MTDHSYRAKLTMNFDFVIKIINLTKYILGYCKAFQQDTGTVLLC